MRRAQVNEFGGADLIQIVEVDMPVPGPGQVRVRVEAAGVNPVDYKLRDGSSAAVRGFTHFPLPLGREGYGVVDAVGSGVTLAVGTPVLALPGTFTDRGTHADFVVLPEGDVAPVPSADDPVCLGGVPVAGLTAWHAVHAIAHVGPGQRVLVIGAGGGVGQWLVQLCVAAGAEVWASASGRHAERLRRYGATHVDYTTTHLGDVVPPVDAVFDGVYFDTFEPALDLLHPDGIMVAIPSLADLTTARERGIRAQVASLPSERSLLSHLAELVVSGKVEVEVSAVLPLTELARGHRIVESGHSHGKVVIDLRLR